MTEDTDHPAASDHVGSGGREDGERLQTAEPGRDPGTALVPGTALDPPDGAAPDPPDDEAILARESMVDPQKLLRIAGVVREVLEEARRIRPEPGAVEHLRQVHSRINQELQASLPPKLYQELDALTPDPDPRGASLEELGLAHAEILGWLEGLFQGTQLALQLQAAHAAAALHERSQRPLPSGDGEPDRPDSRYL